MRLVPGALGGGTGRGRLARARVSARRGSGARGALGDARGLCWGLRHRGAEKGPKARAFCVTVPGVSRDLITNTTDSSIENY